MLTSLQLLKYLFLTYRKLCHLSLKKMYPYIKWVNIKNVQLLTWKKKCTMTTDIKFMSRHCLPIQ